MRRRLPLPLIIFLQMLPATLVVPAIRPLFADYYLGGQGAMHAFMSLNMVGAALLVPLVGGWVDVGWSRNKMLVGLAGLDALLLASLAFPLPVALILCLRTLEGAAHVGAATVLISQASARAATEGRGRAMGGAGAGLVAAIVSGSAIGGALLAIDVRAPLVAAAALEALVALIAVRMRFDRNVRRSVRPRVGLRESVRLLRANRVLWIPIGAAFVGRFTIGCIVVTFALFAHSHHGLSDGSVGLMFVLLTLPFALATYPAARIGDRISGTALLGGGMLVYGAALLGLAYTPTPALPVLMVLAGVASGVIFACVLCQAASMAGQHEHGRAMALVNVAGCVGMLLGPVVAGVTIASLTSTVGAVDAYRAVFAIAAGSTALWIVTCRHWLLASWRTRIAFRLSPEEAEERV